jgi:hypothetical protein
MSQPHPLGSGHRRNSFSGTEASSSHIDTVEEHMHKEKRFKPSVTYVHKFSREMLLEFEEAFSLCCTEDGFLPVDKVVPILQGLALDCNPKYYEGHLELGVHLIDFDKYLAIIDTCIENSTSTWMAHEYVCARCYTHLCICFDKTKFVTAGSF